MSVPHVESGASTKELDSDTVLRAYTVMITVRTFENAAGRAFRAGEIPGLVHLSLMQEAIAGALAVTTGTEDAVFSTHRGHGHCIARGVPLESLWAELLGRRGGASGGRGGSMHIFSPSHGVMGTNGIVGANVPLAVGHALSQRLGARPWTSLAVFGEGSAATGAFHEAVQLGALWQVPIVLLCENNGYAEFTSFKEWATFGSVATLARRYRGLRVMQCNGSDLSDTICNLGDAVRRARAGRPVLLEALMSRGTGHYEGDSQQYRLEAGKTVDPLDVAAEQAQTAGISAAQLERIGTEAQAAVEAGRLTATSMEQPDPATLLDHVYAR